LQPRALLPRLPLQPHAGAASTRSRGGATYPLINL
jgi:hypothetical protein